MGIGLGSMTVVEVDSSVYYDFYEEYSPIIEDPHLKLDKYCESENFVGELCACYRMRIWGIEPEYKHMHCSAEKTVDEICPEESCDLYGCQEAILETIQTR